MRKLMLFTIGFTLACVLGVYLLSGQWILLIAAVCLAAMIPLFCLKFRKTRIAAVILLGLCVGLLWNWGFDKIYLSDARIYDGQTVQSQIEISDYSFETDYGITANGKIVLAGRTYRVKCYVYDRAELQPGDRITGSFRLRYTADGGEKAPTYHQGKGIFLLASTQEDFRITPAGEIPAKYYPAVMRQRIMDQLDKLFPEDTLGVARALLLGDSSKLSYEVDSAFQVSGIRHVIAVSGLHVSILFSMIYLFGGRNRIVGTILGIPILVIFAAIAGFTPSIIRACIMQGLMLLALLFDRDYDAPTALAFSALVMLIINPLTITSVSFQLSVSCMIGIFLFSKRIHDYILNEKRKQKAKGRSVKARLIRWSVGSVSVTIGAMITTIPLCAYYFESVSLISILTNLLTLWIVSFIFYGIMAACALSVIWLPLGKAVAWVTSWAIRYVIGVAKLLSKIPLAAVYTNSAYILIWLILCYVLLAVFLCCKKKYPGVLGACMGITLCIAVAISWIEPRLDAFRLTALPVGQGQCLLLQSGNRVYMIDCGSEDPATAADEAAAALLSQGIYRLDGLILTHYDDDHDGGTDYLLSRISADRLYLPVTADDSQMEHYDNLYGDHIRWISSKTELEDKGIAITLYPASANTTGNESSMSVLCQVANCDILITGDTTAKDERKLVQNETFPDLEVLVVGHHGSKTATSLELLHATTPEIAIICVGKDNIYGHPAKETLERLALFGCTVLRTDKQGTVIIKG